MMLYSASLMFKSYHSIPDDSSPILWEEVIVLVQALTEVDAEEIARKFGISRETQYKGEDEDIVTWKFECVQSICEINEFPFKNGTELFSRFLKETEVQSMLQKF